jgi:hypothetical protein
MTQLALKLRDAIYSSLEMKLGELTCRCGRGRSPDLSMVLRAIDPEEFKENDGSLELEWENLIISYGIFVENPEDPPELLDEVNIKYDLTKSLYSQSDETKYQLLNLLTT